MERRSPTHILTLIDSKIITKVQSVLFFLILLFIVILYGLLILFSARIDLALKIRLKLSQHPLKPYKTASSAKDFVVTYEYTFILLYIR